MGPRWAQPLAMMAAAVAASSVAPMAAAGDSSFTVRAQGGTAVPVRVANPGQVVMGTLTVLDPGGAGHTRVYPCAEGRPDASTSNYPAGGRIANFVTVKADVNGDVCFFTTASTHLLWDQSAETAVITYTAGQKVSTYTVVRTDAAGELCVYTSAPAHVLWDPNVVTTAINAHAPVRRLETRPRQDASLYAFGDTAAGGPVRWNPCVSAVRVAVNWGTQAGEQVNLLMALQRVRDATGIPLVLQGTTPTVPRFNNSFGFNGSPGDTDVLVAFSQPGGTDLLTGKEYGAGGFINDAGGQRIRRGFLVIDQILLAKQGQAARVALYLHELGHVVGLGAGCLP